MGKIPVGKTIGYAYAFTFGNFGTVIGVMWLPLLLMGAVAYFALAPAFGTILELAAAGTQAAPQQAAQFVGQFLLGLIAFLLASWFFSAMIAVGLTRAALGLDGGRAVFFSIGRTVWLMMGAFFIFIVIYLVANIVLGIGEYAVTAIGKASNNAVLAAFLNLVAQLVSFVLLFYISLRLGFLLAPVTVAENRIDLKRGWDLTLGNVWRMVGIYLAIHVPIGILFGAAIVALIFGFVPELGNALTRALEAMSEIQAGTRTALPQMDWPEPPMELWIGLGVVALIYTFLITGLEYAASAFAYRALVPAEAEGAAVAPSGDLRAT